MEPLKFDNSPVVKLFDEYAVLRTFAQVAEWDLRAQAEIERISQFADLLARHKSDCDRALERAKSERLGKNVVSRIFHSRSEERDLEAALQHIQRASTQLEEIADQLQEMIDFTPNDEAERKLLLKELKTDKKELQIKKRELASEIKAVRTESRQVSAKIETYGIRQLNKMAALQRRQLRRMKEEAIKPAEDARAALDRQILAIDRRVTWLERFGAG